ncbi:MAG: hypothetical protein A2428_17815 [Bdellovibrionales bacterium RIFOXYC1_FULL_54_43]|nr:MAG: hypothetical protein A2428_17815 [Bdellovibrionales bacterium RIFOXYC1_FULL_54_43]
MTASASARILALIVDKTRFGSFVGIFGPAKVGIDNPKLQMTAKAQRVLFMIFFSLFDISLRNFCKAHTRYESEIFNEIVNDVQR